MPTPTTRNIAVLLFTSLFLGACGGEQAPPVEPLSPEEIQALSARADAYAGRTAAELRGDADAGILGQELFSAHCASCHGLDARGGRNLPDLVAGVLDYGDSEEAIRFTITNGRRSIMPALGSTLGEVELGAVVAWVRSLSTGERTGTFSATARQLFDENCVVCHGPEAKGNPLIGAPDLSDTYWQHGGEMMNVRLTITRGVESVCPPQAGVLSPAIIELLTAQVLRLRETSGG